MNRRTALAWTLIVASLGGCQAGSPPTLRDATDAERAAAFDQTIAPADRLMAQLLCRWAVTVATGPGLSSVPRTGANFALRHTPGTHVSWGCAVVVDGRGYLATAAHLVGPDPILVLALDDKGLTVRPARVVYRGNDAFDFAVLQVAGPLVRAIDWGPTAQLTVGTPLVGVGAKLSEAEARNSVAMGPYAGRLVQVETLPGPDGPFLRLTGSLPGRHGDSGGPQFTLPPTTSGRGLAGITTSGDTLPTGERRSYAVRPDVAWLRRVINADRKMLAALGPPTTQP